MKFKIFQNALLFYELLSSKQGKIVYMMRFSLRVKLQNSGARIYVIRYSFMLAIEPYNYFIFTFRSIYESICSVYLTYNFSFC